MLTTTSTSYLLLASLDAARRQLATKGYEMISRTLKLADEARRQINEIPYLYCAGSEILNTGAAYDFDPTKIIISVKDLGITGYDAEVWLREHYRIEVELSDLYNILCLVTSGDTETEIELLIRALTHLSETYRCQAKKLDRVKVQVPEIPLLALSPRDAFYSETEVVPLKEAGGRISAEFVMVYPPGIPIFMPGEIITEDNIHYIHQNMEAGLPVQGPQDETLQTIRVIKEHRAFQ